MEQEKVNQLLMMMGSKIPSESIPMVRDRLLKSDMSESDFLILVNGMKDPTLSLILSILVGILGVDRFYIGDDWTWNWKVVDLWWMLHLGFG